MIEIDQKEWEVIRDGMADISCWFMGFKAAWDTDRSLRLPPQLQEIEDMINTIKRRVHK